MRAAAGNAQEPTNEGKAGYRILPHSSETGFNSLKMRVLHL